MKEFFKKLTSRKFILALGGVITGLAMAFGVDSSTVETIVGATITLISSLTYIFVEGKIDAKNVITAIESAETIAETIEEVKEDIKEGE